MELKELIQYIINTVKFWVIVNEWQGGVHLRFGKIRRVIKAGMYLKLPIIDSYHVQPIRLQEIPATHINALTKDGQDVTVSGSAWYIINDVKQFYLGYSEPNEVVSSVVRSAMVMAIEKTNLKDLKVEGLECDISKNIELFIGKGFKVETFKVVTISKARVYRLIKDNLYTQFSNNLDDQHK